MFSNDVLSEDSPWEAIIKTEVDCVFKKQNSRLGVFKKDVNYMHQPLFKLHKPTILTDESIGKEYVNDGGSKGEIISTTKFDDTLYFLWRMSNNVYLYDRYGKPYNDSFYSLTKQVKND